MASTIALSIESRPSRNARKGISRRSEALTSNIQPGQDKTKAAPPASESGRGRRLASILAPLLHQSGQGLRLSGHGDRHIDVAAVGELDVQRVAARVEHLEVDAGRVC